MVKKQNQLLLIGLVAVAALILLGGGSFLGTGSLGAFTTLGVSNVQLVSTDPVLNGEAIIVNLVQGGLGQYIDGELASVSKEQLTSQLASQNKVAGKGFRFTSEDGAHSCSYPIQVSSPSSSSPPFAEYSYIAYDDFSLTKPFQEGLWFADCTSRNSAPLIAYGKYSGSFTYWCVYSRQLTSNFGELPSQGNYSSSTLFSFKTDGGGVSTQTVSNSQSVDARFGNDAYVRFTGFVGNGDASCTSIGGSNPASAFYYPDQSKWILIKQTDYSDYKAKRNDFESYILSHRNSADRPTVEQFYARVNTARQSAISNQVTTKINPQTAQPVTLEASGNNSAGQIRWIGNVALYPTYVLYIKAASLQIHTPVTHPIITNAVSIPQHRSGELGFTSITVNNDGEAGNFDLIVSCDNGSTQGGATQTKTLGAGQTETYNIGVTTSCLANQTNNCTAKTRVLATDVSTKPFTDSCNLQQVCIPNLNYCSGANGKTVLHCNSSGIYDVAPLKICSATESCDVSNPNYCVSGSAEFCGNGVCSLLNGETQVTCPADCGNPNVCNNNGICDNGETNQSCPNDCHVPPVCSSGQHLVQKDTPNTLFGFIPWFGTTVTSTCVPDLNINLVLIGLIVGVAIIIGFSMFRKKGKGRR